MYVSDWVYVTWAASDGASMMVSIVCTAVDEITWLIPHAQLTDISHCKWNCSRFPHADYDISILSRRDTTTNWQTGRVGQSFTYITHMDVKNNNLWINKTSYVFC